VQRRTNSASRPSFTVMRDTKVTLAIASPLALDYPEPTES
jgi:hypothetical protein